MLKLTSKLKNIPKHFTPKNVLRHIKNMPKYLKALWLSVKETLVFLITFFLYLMHVVVLMIIKPLKNRIRIVRKLRQIDRFFSLISEKLDNAGEGDIKRFEIFSLAFRNMSSKKSRTFITIGGMAVGVAIIVFLVSVGYGLQRLVVNKVARLEELRQADVSIQPGSNIALNDEALTRFEDIGKVDDVLPLVGVVGKVEYQSSISDVAVYGVETSYLENSAILTAKGKLFDSSKVNFDPYEYINEEVEESTESTSSTVLGLSDKRLFSRVGEVLGEISFAVFPGQWVPVYNGPSKSTELLGYTKHIENLQDGVEVFGDSYLPEEKGKVVRAENGAFLGRWVKSEVYLWEKEDCDKELIVTCEDGEYMPILDEGEWKKTLGYFSQDLLMTYGNENKVIESSGEVLGISSDQESRSIKPEVLAADTEVVADTPAVNEDDLNWLRSIIDLTPLEEKLDTVKKVNMHPEISQQAVVNDAFIQLLNINRDEAVGKQFNVSFVVTSSLIDDEEKKVESNSVTYEIVGVTSESSIPLFYVPLLDLKSMGITNYSQAKVVAETPDELDDIRKNIEAMGFTTDSVKDTVNQINSLFSVSRIILLMIGSVALVVAAFGMFNTLTVSLLERTREVGLMKTMGMTSDEVQKLFLTESLLMGFMGGLLGVLLGFLGGKMLSIGISALSVSKGVGVLDISYVPTSLAASVLILSVIVGILTGVYPSRRARSISALNALRYE